METVVISHVLLKGLPRQPGNDSEENHGYGKTAEMDAQEPATTGADIARDCNRATTASGPTATIPATANSGAGGSTPGTTRAPEPGGSGTTTATGGIQGYGAWTYRRSPSARLPIWLKKMGPGDDPKAFLVTFEQMATMARWPPEQWATPIAPYLSNPA